MSSLPPQQWQRLQHSREDSVPRPDRARTASAEAGPDPPGEERIDPVAAVFRDHYTQFESIIPSLFRSDHPCCIAPEIDISALPLTDAGNVDSCAPTAAPVPLVRQAEDDDYDFDEDEEEDVARKSAPTKLSPPKLASQSTQSSAGAGEESKVVVATRERLEADRKAVEDRAKSMSHTMFFTLENDGDAMLEQQKLDESDRQVNAEDNAAQDNAPGKLSNANLGASSLTLKHLIARIDAKRELVKVSDMELRNLMSEVRKNRSKWANEDKIGQEELYEAAEKVVLELRAMTEHSTAFLNRVNKREAPDYYQIIRHPMDLGTVMKKLRGRQYKSKKEFVDDLNLIWANCLQYNAEPSHFLRKHAKAMQKHTQELEPLIPDIVIRDRAEVEAEEAGGQEVDAEGESDDEPIMSTRGRKGPGTKKTRKGAPQPREGTPDVKPPIVNLIRADSNPPGTDSQPFANGFLTPTSGTPVPNGVAGSLSQIEIDHDKIDDDIGDAEFQAWKRITKKGRARVATERHKLLRGDRINLDAEALIRSREKMGRYVKRMEKHLRGVEDEGDQTLAGEEAEEEEQFLPDYYDPLAVVPELPWRTMWASDGTGEVEMPDENMKRAPRGIFTAPKSELGKKMDANMKQMQETRKICSKISVIKQMQMQTQFFANQFQKYEPAQFVERDVEDFVISDNGPIMTESVSRAALQRTVGKIFYHAGFEEFQPTAIDAVTDIATDYFQKLGKTLMLYKEAPQNERSFSPEEMLLHTLWENGADVESLDSYISDDIVRLGTRVTTMFERMRSHLADLLRPALADTGGDDSKLFNDGSEQFVGGDFAEDIGDDFFGFKELGLDKEFGLASLSVPLHLLQGRIHYNPTAQITNSAASAEGHKPPPPFEPVTHELVKSQITLVQNFFYAKLHASGEPLVEDEDLPVKQRPPKPRLPPTGKISMPRKRPLQGQGGGSKKKKKLNPTPAEKKKKDEDSKESVKMERAGSGGGGGGDGGMMSPESLAA